MPNASAAQKNGRAVARKRSIADARKGISTSTKAGAALISPNKPLTDQQRLFVKFWAQGESPLSASVKAGYSDGGTFAYRMIYMPNILQAYQEEKDRYERDSGMSRKRVIDGFLEAIEMAKTMADPGTMVAGWREVGKMCGYYEPVKVQHTHTHEGRIQHEKLDRMSDEELAEIMQRGAQALLGQEAGEQGEQGALPAPEDQEDAAP